MWKAKLKRAIEILVCIVLFVLQITLEQKRYYLIKNYSQIPYLTWAGAIPIYVGNQPILLLLVYSLIYFMVFTTIVYLITKDISFTKLLAAIDIGLFIFGFLLMTIKNHVFHIELPFLDGVSLLIYRLTNSPMLYILIVPTYFLHPNKKKGDE